MSHRRSRQIPADGVIPPMIDRRARTRLAERLRQLASGAITNFEFDDRRTATKDRAVREIEWLLAWPTYDDTFEHRLQGRHALTLGMRRDFARAVLFLKTELSYRWERQSAVSRVWRHLKSMLRDHEIKTTELVDEGDPRVWPFWCQADYHAALKSPAYLGAKRSSK